MKRIEAVIKLMKLNEVIQALSEIAITELSASEVRSFAVPPGDPTAPDTGREFDFRPQVEVKVTVSDQLVGRVVESIERAAKTGRLFDGKIFVLPVEEVIDIRTGATADQALALPPG